MYLLLDNQELNVYKSKKEDVEEVYIYDELGLLHRFQPEFVRMSLNIRGEILIVES